MKIGNISIPSQVLSTLFPIILYIIYLSENPFLTLFLIGILPITLKLVTFPHQPGIVFFIFLFHWIQISFTAFSSTFSQTSINVISWSNFGETAVWYCSIALLALALGIRVWLKKIKPLSYNQLQTDSQYYNFNKTLSLYFLFLILNIILKPFLFSIAGLTQILLRILELKVVFLYILIYISFLHKKYYKWVISIALFEFILGFTGYFSSFKNIIFYLIISLIPLLSVIKFRHALLGSIAIISIFYLAVSWQAIKSNYRTYLNQGSKTQTVQVSKLDALSKLQNLLSSVSSTERTEATLDVFDRIAYTKFIANAMDYIPTYKPHQNGRLWIENFSFAIVPRILNPNKKIKDDSQKLIEYTGIQVATGRDGTSISLGYFGDSYVDFGYIGMIPMTYFIGFLIGGLFFLFYQKTTLPIVLKHGFINVIFFNFYTFENDGIVVAGSLTINFFYYTFIYFVILTPLSHYVYSKNKKLALTTLTR